MSSDHPNIIEVRHTLEEHGAIRRGVVPVDANGQPVGPVKWLYQCGELLEDGEGFPWPEAI